MQNFKKKLVIGYTFSLALLLVSAVASYFSIRQLLAGVDSVRHTNEVISNLNEALSTLKDAETGQRGFLLTDDDRFLEPYNGSLERILKALTNVKNLTKDSPKQQVKIDIIRDYVTKRFDRLSSLVTLKKQNKEIPTELLMEGKTYMDTLRRLVVEMSVEEEALLKQRTVGVDRFANSTSILIIVASLLSIIITLISFYRMMGDFNRRHALQQELEKKDKDITQRLQIIEGVAGQISSGDYSIRVDDEKKDALGGIAVALNQMAESLEATFKALSDKEWLKSGEATLNNEIIGDKDISQLTRSILDFVVAYSGSEAGAFYVVDGDGELRLQASYALTAAARRQRIKAGEGMAGQAAVNKTIMEVTDLQENNYVMSFVAGDVKPVSIIAIPILFNQQLKGIIELASLRTYTSNTRDFFKAVSSSAGVALNTAQNRAKVQELLEETQAQSEELQSQHNELENINAELEAQAEKLQASDEELRVQQEELQEANQELEERSRLLEEKNELILERNLEIQGKAEELALSTRYKSEFLANMSHELRTPLNSILLLSRLLWENAGGNLSNDQKEYASVIQSSGQGLLTLIDEILDLSKIESGKMVLEYSDVKFNDLISELNALFAPLAKEKNVEFSIEQKNGLPSLLETDRLRLTQVLRNLLSNALKFTPRGSVKLTIEKKNDAVAFTVKDTGIGIAADKQQTIFEAFQQADGSTRRQFGGTGLGLSISRELARLLGGSIELVSEEGKGSEFTLTVPLQKGQLPSPEKEELFTPDVERRKFAPTREFIEEIIPSPIPDDRENVEANDKVILIIEDDTAFARSLLEYTRNRGYKGVVAVSGDQGMALAKQYSPVGILLDVQLPVKNGWEVMEELKSDPQTRPIPVHMMSVHDVKIKSLSKGAVDFINKPVAFEKLGEIFQRIEQALSQHPKKVLIVEENTKHAKALAYFLETYQVNVDVRNSVQDGIQALNQGQVNCVILDMGIPSTKSYDILEDVKKSPGLENLPIIVFTGKNLSHVEEMKIRQYADSIVVKTAHSYQRIIDEVSLFLHVMEENKKDTKTSSHKRLGELSEVLKGKTVLIADDDVRNIFSLTKSLEYYGMNILTAIDGKDALKQLEQNDNVDLVLMDMMMPEMDGYESTQRIRNIPRYRNLPVIAVTAKAMTGDREKCMAAGASDYITKPVDLDQLISLLRVWLYD